MSRSVVFLINCSVCILFLCFSGCIKLFPGLKGGKQPLEYLVIDYPLPQPVSSEPLGGTLLMRRLNPSALCSTDRILTQDTPFFSNFFYYNRWAVNPSSMLNDFLFRDLSNACLFQAVMNGPGFLRPAYELSGTLETFQAGRGDGGWETQLVVNILFYPYALDSTSAVAYRIFQKRYSVASPCEDDDAESIARSLSACTQKFSQELIEDLKRYLVSQKTP